MAQDIEQRRAFIEREARELEQFRAQPYPGRDLRDSVQYMSEMSSAFDREVSVSG